MGPTDDWILQRLARRLARKLPYAKFVPWRPDPQLRSLLAYYVNYALYDQPTAMLDVGFFTHPDEQHRFLERARQMDHCVSMSKLYADWLRDRGVDSVTHVPMGFDYYRYRPTLVLGVIGRLEHPRKGRQIIDQLRRLPYVEIVTTEGALSEDQLRDVYQRIDYVLIPATVEGGPMSLLEGLAMGKPVIAPNELGMVPEFGDSLNIHHYALGDVASLEALVAACYARKLEVSRTTERRTWDHWAADHHELFAELLHRRGQALPQPARGFRFGLLSELEFGPKVNVESLEDALDEVATHLYFGEGDEARRIIQEQAAEFPFAVRLLNASPFS